jgi:hypothetical protein
MLWRSGNGQEMQGNGGHQTFNQEVMGSNPIALTNKIN